jgi:uncharacterized protein involved in exopolysaccharide biosynthesis
MQKQDEILENRYNDYEDEIDLIEIIQLLWSKKYWFVVVTLLAGIIGFFYATSLPDIFKSEAVILLPTSKGSGLSSMLGSLGGAASMFGFSFPSGSPTNNYKIVLESRTLKESIIKKYDFKTIYEKEFDMDTLDTFSKNSSISETKDGTLKISFEDKDPKRAKDVVDEYIKELEKYNITNIQDENKKKYLFLEKRIEEVEKELKKAEEELKNFTIINNVYNIESQSESLITIITDLSNKLVENRIALNIALSMQNRDNQQIALLENSIKELERQIFEFENKIENRVSDAIIPLKQIPDSYLKYQRLYRNVKMQASIYEILIKEFELLKLTSSKDETKVVVLDEAKVPEKKSKPQKSIILVIVVVLANMVLVFGIFFEKYYRNNVNEPLV